MTNSSILFQNIFKLSIPIFFANLVIPLVAIVDTGLMGNLDNAKYLVATSIAASIFSILFGSFGFLRSGTVGMIAQADGSKDYEEIINKLKKKCSVVMVTSDKCYKNKEFTRGYSENDELGGDDFYSSSKASTEIMINSFYKSFIKKNNKYLRISTARAGERTSFLEPPQASVANIARRGRKRFPLLFKT